ncbi:interferon alpha/beta receptor 2-like isoform X2 [Brachyistius frenatus]|uniref:interferon alpha/beta receptor 2-like isoform X2 n=1 Tax=Brachyistius frenatus TaxID=100188 RepID=UPI0037E910AD
MVCPSVMTTAVVWTLTWLPLVLPAMSELPMPVNVRVTPSHYNHTLTWEAGPGTPAGVSYSVTVITERSSSQIPVVGCERVQQPLVCDLTAAFSDPVEVYITAVTAVLDKRKSEQVYAQRIKPITHFGLPLLSVTACGANLCIDLQPPTERHRGSYDILSYQLRIDSDNGDKAQFLRDTRSLRTVVLDRLGVGRRYCVSIRFSDSLEDKESNFSRPACTPAASVFSEDLVISIVFIPMVIIGLVIVALFRSGFICLKRTSLPSVLETVHHIEEVLVMTPRRSSSSSSLLNVLQMAPSAGEKQSGQSSSDESDGESEPTEGTGESTGGDYKLRIGANLLSSSSSSSSSSLSATPQHPAGVPSERPSDFNLQVRGQSSDGVTGGRRDEEEEKEDEEEEAVVGGGGRDSHSVNLLTLTFSRLEEEEEEEEEAKSHPDIESLFPPVPPSQTCGAEGVAMETVSLFEEEEEEEDVDELCGYMRR